MADDRVSLDTLDTGRHAALPAHVILQQWRRLSPVLRAPGLTLREPNLADAGALRVTLSADEIARFADPAPVTVGEFERFIEWSQGQRVAGVSVTFAAVPNGHATPVGLFQVRAIEPAFAVAEWQFALGSEYWGDGLFFSAAPLVADFVFDVLRARRLEARVTVRNGRGNGALRKLGAVQEALLRQSLVKDDVAYDQVLWAILADDWRARRPTRYGHVH